MDDTKALADAFQQEWGVWVPLEFLLPSLGIQISW